MVKTFTINYTLIIRNYAGLMYSKSNDEARTYDFIDNNTQLIIF